MNQLSPVSRQILCHAMILLKLHHHDMAVVSIMFKYAILIHT
jgi:hypothetical protein